MPERYTVIEGRGETDDTYRYLSIEPPLTEEQLSVYANELGCTAIFTDVSACSEATELEFHFHDADEANKMMPYARRGLRELVEEHCDAEIDICLPEVPVSGSAPLSEQYARYVGTLEAREAVQV